MTTLNKQPVDELPTDIDWQTWRGCAAGWIVRYKTKRRLSIRFQGPHLPPSRREQEWRNW